MGQVAPDGIEEELGIALASEMADLAGAAGVLPPAGAYRPSDRLSMLAISSASLSVTAVSNLPRDSIGLQFVLSPQKSSAL